MTIKRVLSDFADILFVFTQAGNAGPLLSVLVGASLIRIGIAYANRSVLLDLKDMAGIAKDFALYGVALAIIGYIASSAVLTLEEMAGGCRSERRTPSQPRRLESASA
jgi:hypothetical protein